MCKRLYLIKAEDGRVLDVFQGTAKSAQKYVREEYHQAGIKASMKRASRQELREQQEDEDALH